MLGEVDGEEPPVHLIRLEKAENQPVAVAAQGVYCIGFGQLHQVAQESQTVAALFQQITDQDQIIVRGEVYLLHKGTEKGEISVDIADRDDAAPRLKNRPDYDRLIHDDPSLRQSVCMCCSPRLE